MDNNRQNSKNMKTLLLLLLLLPLSISLSAQCMSGDCDNGNGVYVYPSGNRYDGTWKDKQRVKGDLFYANGDHYTGYFKNNERHGPGIYRYASGNRFEGIFTEGEKVEGKFYYVNGNRYEGQYADNKKNGRGTMYLNTGDTLSGFWIDDEYQGKPDYAGEEQETFVVIVGVSDYKNYKDLTYCDDDAYAFRSFLLSPEGGSVPSEHITLLLDSQATRANILRAMRIQFGKAREQDKIIFYFSGHGGIGAFCPYDVNSKEGSNLLEHKEIKRAFRRSKASNKICLADACYSGSIRKKGSDRNIEEEAAAILMQIELEAETRDDGRSDARVAVFMSSRGYENSLEESDLKQGIFTYFLINGMTGLADANNNMQITYGELFNYVNNSVSRHTNGKQHPVLQCDQCSDAPFLYLQ